MAPTPEELGKEASRLVATDRQLAGAVRSALRQWARQRKATTRAYVALAFADAIEQSLTRTTVTRSEQRAARGKST